MRFDNSTKPRVFKLNSQTSVSWTSVFMTSCVSFLAKKPVLTPTDPQTELSKTLAVCIFYGIAYIIFLCNIFNEFFTSRFISLPSLCTNTRCSCLIITYQLDYFSVPKSSHQAPHAKIKCKKKKIQHNGFAF